MTVDHDIGIQMKQKELTKAFMMISNCKKPFDLHGLYNIYQLGKGYHNLV